MEDPRMKILQAIHDRKSRYICVALNSVSVHIQILPDQVWYRTTQQNSSRGHCAVTGQWLCGDYSLTY